MKRVAVLIPLLVSLCSLALAADAPALLPQTFAGWEKAAPPRVSQEPADADATNAAVLKEYNFAGFESATYTRPGRKLSLKAARFADASGAYGAFTFYKEPQMVAEKIGDQGASANERIIFYRGNVLVQAMVDHVTAMTAGELRQLAEQIPLPAGPARSLPVLPTYLPRQAYVKNSAKYVVGPVGLAGVAAPVSADTIDFSRGAEVVLGKYSTGQGTASLLLISYPTPQIAGEKLHAFESMIQNPQPGTPAEVAPVAAKRSGPMVALVSGQISAGEAKSLLASINYDANVTWNEGVFLGKKNNAGNLIVNAILLTGIILGMCVVAGVAFGGVRILMKRLYPDRVFDRPQDIEIIRLNLRG